MPEQPTKFPLVDSASALADLEDTLRKASLIALDTEFVRERTYFPELCVLQIATDNCIAAIDCLADIDLGSLLDRILEPDRTWLLHSARQDLEVLFIQKQKLPARLFDTQIAAGLLGMPAQTGLQDLLSKVLDVAIPKQHTRANWSRRPLPDAWLGYALDDVRYLLPLWQELEARLEDLGRLSWFHEECERQLRIPIEPDARTILERTRGTGSLRGRQRAAAMALVTWREERARDRNRPRRWILADDQLVRIAASLPESRRELSQVRELPERLVARSGQRIIEVIGAAKPVDEPRESPPPDKTVVKALQAEIRDQATKLGIQPELLATRRDIALIATGETPEPFASGWRQSVLAETLARFSQRQAS